MNNKGIVIAYAFFFLSFAVMTYASVKIANHRTDSIATYKGGTRGR